MHIITLKTISATIIFLISLLMGLLQTKLVKNKSSLLCTCDSFASGVFMSVALLHLLPEADRGFTKNLTEMYYPIAQLLCLTVFIIFLIMERGLLSHDKHCNVNHHEHVTPLILIFFLSIHSLVEGVAIGTSISFAETIMIFFAVLAHKGSESFALATNLYNSGMLIKKIQNIILLFSFTTPLGIFMGSFLIFALHIDSNNIVGPVFNAIAAGTFLYLGTEHLIKCKKSLETFKEITPFIFGMAIMALVEIVFIGSK
jgi:zinc transporter 1/2/3